jgi:Sel1 repeat
MLLLQFFEKDALRRSPAQGRARRVIWRCALALLLLHGVPFAEAVDSVAASALPADTCPDLSIANALAIDAPNALPQAERQAQRGDMLARELILEHDLEELTDSHAWYTPDGRRKALALSREISGSVRKRDPGTVLLYDRILDTRYYYDPLGTTAYYTALGARNAHALSNRLGTGNDLYAQLQLRRDLSAVSTAVSQALISRVAIGHIGARVGSACGALYAEQMGSAYAEGTGVAQNLRDAEAWYQRAAAGGVIAARYNQAAIMMNEQRSCHDGMDAIGLLQSAALDGYARALVLLGRSYQRGICVQKDLDSAEQFYEEAARRGSLDGKFRLALVLADDVYSPVRWARGVILLNETLNTNYGAVWAMSGVAEVYTALCIDQRTLSKDEKAMILRDAAFLGVAPHFRDPRTPVVSQAACAAAGRVIPPEFLRAEKRAIQNETR